jgi:hypothetical protein
MGCDGDGGADLQHPGKFRISIGDVTHRTALGHPRLVAESRDHVTEGKKSPATRASGTRETGETR